MSALLIIGLKNAILVIPLALIAMAVGRWSKRPALTHLMWVLVLVKMLTPPLVNVPVGWQLDVASWLQPSSQSTGAGSVAVSTSRATRKVVRSDSPARNSSAGVANSAAARTSESAPQVAVQSTESRPARFETPSISRSVNWSFKPEILIAVWAIGSLYILSSLVWQSYLFHRFLKLVERRHESLGPRAAELAQRARITIAPRVIVVDSVVSPMLWGMGRRASLVFPAKLISRLSPLEVDALLLHELAHFARGDHWVRVLELVASVLYWWHPVFWWARRELEVSEEQCCDAWVVEHQSGSRHSYAEALLATIDFLHEPATHRPPVACGLGEVPFLRIRLTQIMRGQVAARLPQSLTAAVVIGGLLCSPLEPNVWANSSTAQSMYDLLARAVTPMQPIRAGRNLPSQIDRTRSGMGVDELVTPTMTVAKSADGTPVAANSTSTTRPFRAPTLVWAAAHSPNGRYHVEARVGQGVKLVYPSGSIDLSSHQITCVAFAPDSVTFATGHDDMIVRRWDSDTGGMLQPQYRGCDSPITSLHISPNGTQIAAGTRSGIVVVWDVASTDEIARLERPGSAISCVRWSPNGEFLAVGMGDWSERQFSGLVLWSPTQDLLVHEQSLVKPVGALDWMRGNDSLLLVEWDGHSQVWNLAAKQVLSEMQFDKDQVSAAAWSADCLLLNKSVEIESRAGLNP